MGFVNIQLPEHLSNGSVLGPSWDTTVQETPGGARYANQRQSRPRWRYDLAKTLLTLDDDERPQIEAINDLVRFFNAVRGARNTWKLWDPIDHSTHPDGRTIIDDAGIDDATIIGVGDGSTNVFQLRKAYTFGGETVYRPIVLPKLDTCRVWVDGSIVGVSDRSFGETDGKVTLTWNPDPGHVIKASCAFYVHAAFTEEVDRWLAVEGANNIGSISSIPVVEVMTALPMFDAPFAGGSTDHSAASLGNTYDISAADGAYQRFLNTTGSSVSVWLPLKASITGTGGPIFYIANHDGSDANINVRDKDTGATLDSVAPGETLTVALTFGSSSNLAWRAWQ